MRRREFDPFAQITFPLAAWVLTCIRATVATIGLGQPVTANTSAGVCHPRVLRGRSLSLVSMTARSTAVTDRRSMPLRRYWRTSPCFRPCRASTGSQDRRRGRPRERAWRPCRARPSRCPCPRSRSAAGRDRGQPAPRQERQRAASSRALRAGEPGAAVVTGARPRWRRRTAHRPDDEVALPVAKTAPLVDHGRTVLNPLVRHDEPRPALIRAPPMLAQRSPRPQSLGEPTIQPAAGAAIERLVDRLMAQMPVDAVRIGGSQVRGDLLRTPLLLELCLHHRLQLGITGKSAAAGSCAALAISQMSEHRVVRDLVLGRVAAQLPAHRRSATLQPPCDLAH